jgi:hypothetical protein
MPATAVRVAPPGDLTYAPGSRVARMDRGGHIMSILTRRHHSAQIPKVHESYMTYLYWGFALVFLALMIIGFTLF